MGKKEEDNWILGLGGSGHDFSAALARGLDIKVAIESERLTRRKHGRAWSFENPLQHPIAYCLETENLSLSDVHCIVGNDLLPMRARQEYPLKKLILYHHHICHAASVAAMIPPNHRTAILVYDGMGSIRSMDDASTTRETFSFYLLENNRLTCLGETMGRCLREDAADFSLYCTNSIGHFYKIITHLIGFGSMEEGKTMGLAAHGFPRFYKLLKEYVNLCDDINACFVCDPIADKMADKIELILKNEGDSFKVRADFAASVQILMDEVLMHCWGLLQNINPDIVCISGGCALNSVSNGKLAQNLPLNTQLIIPPYAGDAGLSIGAIWLHQIGNFEKTTAITTFRGQSAYHALARPGRNYSEEECHNAVAKRYPMLAVDDSVRSAQELAKIIASGKIVGVFHEGSEIGPRALGGRSILADPRRAEVRERLNRDIKLREPFRPLAPMILEESFHEYFCEPRQKDPFMLKVAYVTDLCRREAPAVVHIDGTARVQCISPHSNPFLVELLQEFKRLTNLPMLLNTSFNRRGEPIVENPTDAIDCFLGLNLDGLFLGNRYFFRYEA